MLHTIPLIMVTVQLGTSIISIVNSLESTNAMHPESSHATQQPTQFIVDIVVDVITLLASTGGLVCLLYAPVMNLLLSTTAFNVASLLGGVLRIVIQCLHKSKLDPDKEDSSSSSSSSAAVAASRDGQLVDNKPNILHFVLILFFNSVFILLSGYMITVLLCLIRRKDEMTVHTLLVYYPQEQKVSWWPRKYGRLLPILASLLALTGCVAMVGFIVEAVLLSEFQPVGFITYWAGLHNGLCALITGIFLVLTMALSSKNLLCTHVLALYCIVLTAVSSVLAFHGEHPEFHNLQTNSLPGGKALPNNLPTYYRQIYLAKVTLITFASVFNIIFVSPLILFLILHMTQNKSIQIITDNVSYSQPPSYHQSWSQHELIPMESVVDMSGSSLLARVESNDYPIMSANNSIRLHRPLVAAASPHAAAAYLSHLSPQHMLTPLTTASYPGDCLSPPQMQYFMYSQPREFYSPQDFSPGEEQNLTNEE